MGMVLTYIKSSGILSSNDKCGERRNVCKDGI